MTFMRISREVFYCAFVYNFQYVTFSGETNFASYFTESIKIPIFSCSHFLLLFVHHVKKNWTVFIFKLWQI